MPLLRRPHDHHRDLRARPIPALPTINANHRDQDRHVVTRIPVLRRRRADFACRRFSTDRDDTRQNPPFRRRSKPSRAALNLHLDHERGVLLANLIASKRGALARANRPRQPKPNRVCGTLRQTSPRGGRPHRRLVQGPLGFFTRTLGCRALMELFPVGDVMPACPIFQSGFYVENCK